MTPQDLEFYATLSLALFCIIGAFDGLYFHHFKFKLYRYIETKREHYIHGLRGLVFTPIALLFFVFNTSGVLYLVGFAFLALDIGLEIYDILVERDARTIFGGTPIGETLSHIFATLFRVLALGFIIASKPLSNLLELNLIFEPLGNTALVTLGAGFAVVSFIGGIMHFIPVKRVQYKSLQSSFDGSTATQKTA